MIEEYAQKKIKADLLNSREKSLFLIDRLIRLADLMNHLLIRFIFGWSLNNRLIKKSEHPSVKLYMEIFDLNVTPSAECPITLFEVTTKISKFFILSWKNEKVWNKTLSYESHVYPCCSLLYSVQPNIRLHFRPETTASKNIFLF